MNENPVDTTRYIRRQPQEYTMMELCGTYYVNPVDREGNYTDSYSTYGGEEDGEDGFDGVFISVEQARAQQRREVIAELVVEAKHAWVSMAERDGSSREWIDERIEQGQFHSGSLMTWGDVIDWLEAQVPSADAGTEATS